MSVRRSARAQYQAIANEAARRWDSLLPPTEGWIATLRKALGMSGAQLARRLGVTRARVSRAERAELEGAVTLRTMQQMAAAMGGRFVYAIVPEESVESVIERQARARARAVVAQAAVHMALEDQGLEPAQNEREVGRLAQEYLRDMPADLWSGP